MLYRKFGHTDLIVSEIGFGAWGIGGPAIVGNTPIGWGGVDDAVSVEALNKAFDLGINFFDTADFYGFGHSEKLIGKVFGNSDKVVIASKVGHRVAEDQTIYLDYSKQYVLDACEASLKRLNRESIDLYQLHSARMSHLLAGECIEAMEQLKAEGKIRYWGISLNTFEPMPEAEYLIKNNLCSGFQLVFNIINQRALDVINLAGENNYGVIARMPLQFGLLTGKFTKESKFEKEDHRSVRLNEKILTHALESLEKIWYLCDKYKISKTSLAMSFVMSHNDITTSIPGIKTPEQAELNTKEIVRLDEEDVKILHQMFKTDFNEIVKMM